MLAAFDARRKVIVKELNEVPGFRCIEPGGAFYAFPNIEGTGMKAQALQEKLLEEAAWPLLSAPALVPSVRAIPLYANSSKNIVDAVAR